MITYSLYRIYLIISKKLLSYEDVLVLNSFIRIYIAYILKK